MNGVLSLALMDTAKSVAGVAVANALKLPEKLDFGDSLLMRNASNGTIYFGVSDGINYVSGAGSKILSMDYLGILDDIGFFTATSAVADFTKTDEELSDFIRNTLSVSQDTAHLVTESAIVSGTRFLADYIDQQPQLPSFLHIVRHPVSYITNVTKQ